MRLASAEDGRKTGDRTEVGFFIPLPSHLAEQCPSLAPEDNSVPHATFLYVGSVPKEREGEFLQVCRESFSGLGRVHATLGKTNYFVHPAKERRVAHMSVTFDQDMAAVRRHLRESLDANGFEVADFHPLHYKPHVTLAYIDGFDTDYEGSRPYGGWDFTSIEVWGLPKVHTLRFGGTGKVGRGQTPLGVEPYVSPRERELSPGEGRVRDISYALKSGEPWAVEAAAKEMARSVPTGATLVPVPNSSGDTRANLILAKSIAKRSGSRVVDVLGRKGAVEPSHQRRRRGIPGLQPSEHRMTAGKRLREPVFLIDNVTTTGATFEAARRALGGVGRGLAFSKAREVLARETQTFARIKGLVEEIRKAWPNPWSFRKEQLSPAQVKALTDPVKRLHDLLDISFEREHHQKVYQKVVGRKIANFRKLLANIAKAKTSDEVHEVLESLSTKSKTSWQKFYEYTNLVLGVLADFDVEVDYHQAIGPWNTAFFASPRGDWDDESLSAIVTALKLATREITSAGFGKVLGGAVHAFPTRRLPAGSGTLSGSALASYNTQSDVLSVASSKDVKDLVHSIIHELGHRYYYRVLGGVGREAWESFFGSNVGAPDVDRIIADWESWLDSSDKWDDQKYGRFLFQYYPVLQKRDPDQAMWLSLVVGSLGIREPTSASGYGPKRGAVPGLDQLKEKKGEAKVFLHPVTAYSGTSPAELFAETFAHYIVDGPGRIPEIVREAFRQAAPASKMGSAARVASAWRIAKYKSKEEDDDGNVHYEYGPRQVANRHKEKAERLEKLRKSIGKLRSAVKSGLKSKDEETRARALAVALMDQTYERVGNPSSAEDGHFGVTGWQARHVTFSNGKALLSYTGKSGVRQRKEVTDSETVAALKDFMEGKSGKDTIITCGEDSTCLTPQEVNDYLSEFDITAKDLRGFHANREMMERLKELRKDGEELPRSRKEKDDILKGEFEKALEETAKAVGHEPATLRSDYLVPGLEDSYLHDGTVMDKLKTATKSTTDRDDEETDRLVRPSPKKKPPRKDRRRNRVEVESDPDTDTGDRGDDKDLSLNYKRVAGEENRQSFPYSGDLIGERVGHRMGPPLLFPHPAHRVTRWGSQDAKIRREDMPRRMTRKGAQQVVHQLDKLAALLHGSYEALGLPRKLALDLGYRSDMLSDFFEKSQGVKLGGLQPSVPEKDGWDPTQIGKQESGALEYDKDEKFTRDNFTEQEHRELREKQEAGKLPSADKSPTTGYEGGKQASKKGALQVSDSMDRLANLFEENWQAMGVPRHIALDFSERLDKASDTIEKAAGIKRSAWEHSLSTQPSIPETDGFNPLEIAKREPGALEFDADEPYMKDNFTEQESNELSDKQIMGQLPYADSLPTQDMAGKLAASLAPKLASILAEALSSALPKRAQDEAAEEEAEEAEEAAEAAEEAAEGEGAKKASFDHGFDLFAE